MANKRGLVFSIEKGREELPAIEDELSEWVRALESGFFLPPDAPVIPAFGRISEWVQNQGYEPAAQELFFSVADYYLVAQALAHGFKLVTHEKPADTLRKVKIPNVCIGLGIHHLTPFEMLRRERVRFVLANPSPHPG